MVYNHDSPAPIRIQSQLIIARNTMNASATHPFKRRHRVSVSLSFYSYALRPLPHLKLMRNPI